MSSLSESALLPRGSASGERSDALDRWVLWPRARRGVGAGERLGGAKIGWRHSRRQATWGFGALRVWGRPRSFRRSPFASQRERRLLGPCPLLDGSLERVGGVSATVGEPRAVGWFRPVGAWPRARRQAGDRRAHRGAKLRRCRSRCQAEVSAVGLLTSCCNRRSPRVRGQRKFEPPASARRPRLST